jgi:hyperosmotically inducible periplasmic protein
MPLRWLKWPQGWVGFVLMAVLVAGCAATPEQRSTGEVIDDAAITTKVKTNLLADPVVSGFAISVETSRSVVSLTGIVNSDAERQRAIQIAQDVGEVKQVDAKNLFIKR